jgi:ketosteroid isomerase-like protein
MFMHDQETKHVVRRYHEGWSNRRFEDAIALLAEELRVEVPINDYPTRQSFAQALIAFGRAVESVELLSELASDDEAMLLYDMNVTGLGALRVVEHFTVKNGRIVRLRQIHDTAAIRAAGMGT